MMVNLKFKINKYFILLIKEKIVVIGKNLKISGCQTEGCNGQGNTDPLKKRHYKYY